MNLCLAVSGPEPAGAPRAGWHRIASWFHCIDLFDDVYVERAVDGKSVFDISFAADAPKREVVDWPLEKDLCFLAVKLMEEYSGESLPVRVRVRKRISSGGGLGGGSSDAAAMMRALNSLFGLQIEELELMRLSQKLGSDVAFFMDGDLGAPARPAIVRGFGDQIERIGACSGMLTLVLPDFGCATPQVYAAFDQMHAGPSPVFRDADVARIAATGAASRTVEHGDLFNDLTDAAIQVQPRLAQMFKQLHGAGARPILSGSGSTIFVPGDVVPAGVDAVLHRAQLV